MSRESEAKHVLKLLARQADLISDAYLNRDCELTEQGEDSRAIDNLIKHRLAWRPSGEDEARLSNAVIQLLEHSLRHVNRRHIDGDISSRLENMEGLINSYKTARKKCLFDDAKTMLRALGEQVYELTESLENTTRNLWRQIETDFGYVSSLEMKVLENRRVLEQVKRLNDGLSLVKSEELAELAGSDTDLRHLLVRTLPASVETCQADLTDALDRLRGMLFEFRHLQERSRLVQTFYKKYQQDPGFKPANYADSVTPPELLNQVAPLALECNADTHDSTHEIPLTDLLKGLRKSTVPAETVQDQSVDMDEEEQAVVEILNSPLKDAVTGFFTIVIQKRSLRAIASYHLAPSDCLPDLWLHAITTRYTFLSKPDRALFALEYTEEVDPVFNGVMYVKDIQCKCLR